jgi:hypothetical protein
MIIGLAALLLACGMSAQTIPAITGIPISVNGQSYLLTLNPNGTYTTTSAGVNGSASVTTPVTAAQAVEEIKALINANNPSNSTYYGADEWAARLGGVYLQNSGSAAAVIGITKWFLPGTIPVGIEAALLQGNQSGQSGTAGCYAAVDTRKIIGDVAAVGGLGGGYDNYNKRPMGIVKAGVEYRQNPHLSEWVDLLYALEAKGNASRGLGFAAGLGYSF